MCNVFPSIMGPGIGLFPGNGSVLVKNVTATAMPAGTVCMVDLALSDGDTVSVIPGHVNTTTLAPDSVWACVVIASAAADARVGQFLITLEAIAAGATGRASPTGTTPGVVRFGAGDIAKGQPLVADTVSGLLVPAPAWASFSATSSQNQNLAGQKIIGYALITASIASTNTTSIQTTINVWFNGLGAGFGQNAF